MASTRQVAMPIYEYICKACGHGFEELVRSNSDADKQKCPSCGSKRVERKLSVFAPREGASGTPPCGSADPACGSCCAEGGACPMLD